MSNVKQFSPKKPASEVELTVEDQVFILMLVRGGLADKFPGGTEEFVDVISERIVRYKKACAREGYDASNLMPTILH